MEFPNLYRLSAASREQVRQQLGTKIERDDLRDAVSRRAQKLLEEHSVPVTARMAGMFALDLAIAGVDKARAVEVALSGTVLDSLGMAKLPTPGEIEVWGDRFSRELGTDWLMCKPLDSKVRAISFRDEYPKDLPKEYNIRPWDGAHRLQAGLLEFLEGR